MKAVAPSCGLIGLAVMALVLATVGSLRAQPAEPLHYRRVLVPADALADQIRGLVPMKREEFERRLAMIAPRESREAPRIEQATFRASLEGFELIQGDADLK